jgi:predicted metal-dependent enzyme (double-stranded beta helix superfamily)
MTFDRQRFVSDCADALRESDPQAAVREHLARAVSDHAAVLAAMGEPKEAGFDILLATPQLTIFAAKWAPNMTLVPHNHLMWALIGIYAGREDNIFWKRTANGLMAGGAKAMFAGDVAELPADVIHSVTNPLPRFAAGLHIYGGDFFHTERSQWNAETLEEEPSNGAVVQAMFARENERLRGR